MSIEIENRNMSWGEFRFSIVGCLLVRPPARGELHKKLKDLSSQPYQHPTKDELITFGTSTIERWYYKALHSNDPVKALTRKIREDSGHTVSMTDEFLNQLHNQYKNYSNWTYKLHSDNLNAYAEKHNKLDKAPSYSTVIRHMQKKGWDKKKSHKKNQTNGQKKAALRIEQKEIRGFESEYVNELWHLDFHQSRSIVDSNGKWHKANALCILDDHSRLCCHIQWYLNETADALIHGLCQAFHKRGLPRSLMTDNGSAMIANETQNGLKRLGILHKRTLPYSPYQNGKQEVFWATLEGRLMSMLSGVTNLTLKILNTCTQAWIEQEYNKNNHNGIDTSPIESFINSKNVSRPSLESDAYTFAFTQPITRKQRKSDGTVQINGIRFEIPSRFNHFQQLSIRYQSFDLSKAYIVDPKSNKLISVIYPQDKTSNAYKGRRTRSSELDIASNETNKDELPPLMEKYLAEYCATGLPPAYLPKEESNHKEVTDD